VRGGERGVCKEDREREMLIKGGRGNTQPHPLSRKKGVLTHRQGGS